MNKMKVTLASLICLATLIAVISPVSAFSITDGDVKCSDRITTRSYTVSAVEDAKDICSWIVFWCNKDA